MDFSSSLKYMFIIVQIYVQLLKEIVEKCTIIEGEDAEEVSMGFSIYATAFACGMQLACTMLLHFDEFIQNSVMCCNKRNSYWCYLLLLVATVMIRDVPEVFPAPAPAGKRAFWFSGSGRKKGILLPEKI